MPAARLNYGRWPLLHDAKFSLRFAFDAFTHENPPGWRKAARAWAPDDRVGHDDAGTGGEPQGHAALDTSARVGHLSADLGFDHGRLLPGGTLQWNAPVAITDADGTQQRRRGQLDASVQPQAIDVHVRVPPPVGKRHFHLLHVRDWYQSQPDLIPPQATATH